MYSAKPCILPDFSEFLSSIIMSHNRIVITGNFNIYVNDLKHSTSLTLEFKNLLENLYFLQHVIEYPHHLGNTLDLVMSKRFCIANVSMFDFTFSDQFCVFFDSFLLEPHTHKKKKYCLQNVTRH